jgi:hypothetical protein
MERHQLLRAALEMARSEQSFKASKLQSFKRLQEAPRGSSTSRMLATATATAAARPVDVESLANLVVIMEQSITPPRTDNPRQPRADWGVRSRRRGAEEGGGGIKILPSRFGWDVVQAITVDEKQVDGRTGSGRDSRVATRQPKSEQ